MTGKQLEFTSFYAAARGDCLRIVLVTVGDRQLAEDLVAEAFTRAWASWRTVRRHPAPQAWVVRTALNLNVSWWRHRRRETALIGIDLFCRSVRRGWSLSPLAGEHWAALDLGVLRLDCAPASW